MIVTKLARPSDYTDNTFGNYIRCLVSGGDDVVLHYSDVYFVIEKDFDQQDSFHVGIVDSSEDIKETHYKNIGFLFNQAMWKLFPDTYDISQVTVLSGEFWEDLVSIHQEY